MSEPKVGAGDLSVKRLGELRDRVETELARLQRSVDSLSNELAESRREVRRVTGERDRLKEQLVRGNLAEVAREDADARWQAGLEAQRALERSRDVLEAANAELDQRVTTLATALADERRAHAIARQELVWLREEVGHLTAIVDLLLRERIGDRGGAGLDAD